MNETDPKISQDTIYQVACTIKGLRNSYESYSLKQEEIPEITKKFFFARIVVSEKKSYKFDIAVQDTSNTLKVGIEHVSKDKHRLSTHKYKWLMDWGWYDPKITYPFYFKYFPIRTDQEIYQASAEIILTAISIFDFSPTDPLEITIFEEIDKLGTTVRTFSFYFSYYSAILFEFIKNIFVKR